MYIQKDDVDLIMSRAAAVRIPKSNSGVGGENTADYRFVRRLGSCFSWRGLLLSRAQRMLCASRTL